MKQRGHEDATRQHACVTAGLAAVAAFVLVVLDDPAMQRAPDRAGVGASTAAVGAGSAPPLAGQAPFRQFDAAARPARAPRIEPLPVIRPVLMGGPAAVLSRNK